MPRLERPLVEEDTPVRKFAGDLRRLRHVAGLPSYRELGRLGEELRFALMVSDARVLPLPADAAAIDGETVNTDLPGLRLAIGPSANYKCVRCWHQRPDVGTHAEHPELCGRCVENIAGAGETRLYA